MIYTKKQRHTFYKRLLKRVCNDPRVVRGICNYLPEYSSIDDFPELSKHKPAKGFGSWQQDGDKPFYHGCYFAPCTYKGWETRIKWIVQAINDTK